MKYTLLLLILCSCINSQKATSYLVAHEKLAEVCSITYPVVERYIKGDTTTVYDTLYGAGTVDTLISHSTDTVIISVVKTLPPKTIRISSIIHDTIVKVDNAAVEAEKARYTREYNERIKVTSQNESAKKSRNIWRLIAIGCFVVIGGGIAFKIYKLIK